MGQCSRCNGWYDGYGLCPDCQRNDELAEEQRNIAFDVAEEQERAQQRLQSQAHLDELKRKLLDLAMESVDQKDTAYQKACILMKSASFTDNLSEFWNDIQSNDFLRNCYYQLIFTPSICFSDLSGILSSMPDYVLNGAAQWLNSLPSDLYKPDSITKYKQFIDERKQRQAEENKLIEQRNVAYQKEAAAREKQQAESAARSNAQRIATERRKNFITGGLGLGSAFLFLTGFTLGGIWKTSLWFSEGSYAALAIYVVFAIFCAVRAFKISKTYSYDCLYSNGDEGARLLLYWFSVALCILITILAWHKCSQGVLVILFTSAFGISFIPFVRGLLGAMSTGILGGLLSLFPSYLGGGIISYIYHVYFAK